MQSAPSSAPDASKPVTHLITFTVNGEPVMASAASIASLLAERGLTGKRVAVERNGVIVPKSQHGSTPIAAGDRLEIVVAVGGG